jgi:pimeloyl-ACP methyl ester carboxylesterase
MMSIKFTVHTVNNDQSIWMIVSKTTLMNEVKSTDLRSKSLRARVNTLMRAQEITEDSPLTVQGSFSPDLLISKLWLWEELSRVLDQLGIDHVNAVYVLGSWTGGVSMVLAAKRFPADTVINVDCDPGWITVSQDIADRMGIGDRTQHMIADVNDLDYRQADQPSVVINTSTNDIQGNRWFQNIPAGTIVALQGRDAIDPSLQKFVAEYPMNRIMYQGQLVLQDPETQYHRYMVIGII